MLEHEHKHAVHEVDGIVENRVTSPPIYFTILFYGLIVWGVAFCAFYLLSGWSSEAEFQQKMAAHEQAHQQPEAKAPAPAPSQQPGKDETAAVAAAPAAAEADGSALYAERCAMCHGADAKGGIGPDLTAAEYAYGKTPEAVGVSISDGREGGMPAFGNQLSEEEIEALVEYLLSL